jgi:hypothetical protein
MESIHAYQSLIEDYPAGPYRQHFDTLEIADWRDFEPILTLNAYNDLV